MQKNIIDFEHLTVPNGVTHLNMPLIKVKNPIKPCRKKLWILTPYLTG